VTAMAVIITLSRSCFHSSAVKVDLFAIAVPPR
jgi:hypothetical protein